MQTLVFVAVATCPGNTTSAVEAAGPGNPGRLVSGPTAASVICTYSCLNVARHGSCALELTYGATHRPEDNTKGQEVSAACSVGLAGSKAMPCYLSSLSPQKQAISSFPTKDVILTSSKLRKQVCKWLEPCGIQGGKAGMGRLCPANGAAGAGPGRAGRLPPPGRGDGAGRGGGGGTQPAWHRASPVAGDSRHALGLFG